MSDQPEALRLSDAMRMYTRTMILAGQNDGVTYDMNKAAAELRRLHAECDALRAALKFIADHDLRGTDLTVAGHIAHALIGKARAALKEVK